jgi:alginate O-acetyltransferase complex protein AlgI
VILTTLSIIKVTVITILLIACHWTMRNTRVLTVAYKQKWWVLGAGWGVMLILLVLSQQSGSSFIYFQF